MTEDISLVYKKKKIMKIECLKQELISVRKNKLHRNKRENWMIILTPLTDVDLIFKHKLTSCFMLFFHSKCIVRVDFLQGFRLQNEITQEMLLARW